jgi:hypothetical protein
MFPYKNAETRGTALKCVFSRTNTSHVWKMHFFPSHTTISMAHYQNSLADSLLGFLLGLTKNGGGN